MKVILCEDVDNLGAMGETVKVASGYARNFLFPRRLAVGSDSASARQVEHEMRIIRKKEDRRRIELTEVAKGLATLSVEMLAKSGDNGKLFGSITTLHIAQKLQDLGHDIGRRKILLDEPIKTLGDHKIKINLGAGVEAGITISVLAEEVEEEDVTVDMNDSHEDSESMADAEGSFGPAPAPVKSDEPAEVPAEETAEA